MASRAPFTPGKDPGPRLDDLRLRRNAEGSARARPVDGASRSGSRGRGHDPAVTRVHFRERTRPRQPVRRASPGDTQVAGGYVDARLDLGLPRTTGPRKRLLGPAPDHASER